MLSLPVLLASLRCRGMCNIGKKFEKKHFLIIAAGMQNAVSTYIVD